MGAAHLPSHTATFWVREEGDTAPSQSATSLLGRHNLPHSMHGTGHSQCGACKLLGEQAAGINPHLKALEEKKAFPRDTLGTLKSFSQPKKPLKNCWMIAGLKNRVLMKEG